MISPEEIKETGGALTFIKVIFPIFPPEYH